MRCSTSQTSRCQRSERVHPRPRPVQASALSPDRLSPIQTWPVGDGSPARLLSLGTLLLVIGLLLPGAPVFAQEAGAPEAPAADAPAATERLSLAHHLEWETLQSPRISPDGRQIVYTRRFRDPVGDGWDNELWVMNADGSRNRLLGEGSDPRWSPDGERIAYLREGRPGGTQIWVRWMDEEGAASQVTRMEHGPSSLRWSPDGRTLAFQAPVPAAPDPSWRIDLPDRPGGAEWTEDAHVEDRIHYRRDGTGILPRTYQHLFVVSAEGGSPRQVTHGDWDHGAPRWTFDGQRLVFQSLRVEDADRQWRHSEIYDVEVATREIRQLTDRRGPDGSPVPSPDGRYIALVGHEFTRDTFYEQKLWVMDSDGQNLRELAAELDRTPRNPRWAPDGSGVYFDAEDRGHRHVFFASLDGGLEQVTDGTQVVTLTGMADDGTAVGTLTTAHDPGSLIHLDRGEGGVGSARSPTVLLSSNAELLARVELGEVEEIWYESFDGTEVQGWIVKPPEFDPNERYPLILAIHGGPHIMWDVGFDFAWQEHASNNYVVLYTNPRGSSGYGSAFGNEIDHAYPGGDYDDLMIGVDSLLARGYIDEENLFVYGGSGGGVLTAWIVGHTDRFTAAVSKAPVINWMSFVGTTDGSGWYRNFRELPWDDPSEHLERSPLMYVGNVTTPTMLMTHERDLRTPISQSEEYYMALQMEGVPTAMVRLKDGWHHRREPPSNFYRVQLYLRNWFERHMVGETPATADGL